MSTDTAEATQDIRVGEPEDDAVIVNDEATTEEQDERSRAELVKKVEKLIGESQDSQDTTIQDGIGDDERAADTEESAAEGGEETKDKSEVEEQSWIDEDVRGLASAFGLNDKQLSAFAGRDELERHLQLMDTLALMNVGGDNANQQQEAQAERHSDDPSRRADGTFLPKDQRQEADAQRIESDFKVALDPEEHGQDVVDQFDRLHKFYDSQLSGLKTELSELKQADQQRAYQAFEQQFDETVDSLAMPEFFGETGKESAQQMERRQALMTEFNVRSEVHRRRGGKVDLNKSLLKWMARSAFPSLTENEVKNAQRETVDRLKRAESSLVRPSRRKGGVPEQAEHLSEEQRHARLVDKVDTYLKTGKK